MADVKVQTLENHARLVPLYHYVTYSILFANVLWTLYGMVTAFSFATVMAVLVAGALVLIAFYARYFALRVQDRLIRLEMRLRMRELLPPDLCRRAEALTVRQLVALRFAGDAELPALCAKVLDEQLHDQKAIKRLVRDWRADHVRA
jgi:hypothetical protein